MWIRALTLTALIGVVNAAGPASVTMTTLSSRADFVSGGDALIEVKATAGTRLTQVCRASLSSSCKTGASSGAGGNAVCATLP